MASQIIQLQQQQQRMLKTSDLDKEENLRRPKGRRLKEFVAAAGSVALSMIEIFFLLAPHFML